MFKNMKKLTAVLLAAIMVLTPMTNVFAEGTEAEGAQASGTEYSVDSASGSRYGITTQPEDAVVTEGETAEFKVGTKGDVRSYQWQVSKNNGKRWTNLSSRTYGASDTLSFTAEKSYDGYLFRCVVTFKNFKVSYSQAAKLTVTEKMPEQNFATEDGLTVNVPEGALPEGTTMSVATPDYDAVLAIVNDTKSSDSKILFAKDITFSAEGVELQPEVRLIGEK